jgi:predicted RNase H-like HicB family nuclease
MPSNGAKRREFTVVVERDEDAWYVASVPALPGCHTQARSLDELMQRVQEAIAVSLEDGESASVPQLEFIGVQRISVPA